MANSLNLSGPVKPQRGKVKMKEWRCILVSHHDDVGKAIMEWEQQGWKPNSYNTAGWAEHGTTQ